MPMLCVLAFMRESKIFEFVLYLKHPIWFLSTFLIFTWNLPCKTSDTGLWEPKREKSLESLWKQTLYHVIITTVSFEMRKLRLKEAKWWSQCYMGSEPCRWEAGSGFLNGKSSALCHVTAALFVWQSPRDAACSNHQAVWKGHANFFCEGLNSSSSGRVLLLSR